MSFFRANNINKISLDDTVELQIPKPEGVFSNLDVLNKTPKAYGIPKPNIFTENVNRANTIKSIINSATSTKEPPIPPTKIEVPKPIEPETIEGFDSSMHDNNPFKISKNDIIIIIIICAIAIFIAIFLSLHENKQPQQQAQPQPQPLPQ